MFAHGRSEKADLILTRYQGVLIALALTCPVVVGGCAAAARRDASSDHPATIHLFNGRNLDGFYTYLRDHGRNRDPNQVFTVVDDGIHISGQDWGCLTTNDRYENYHLIAEYRWGDETHSPRQEAARDSGIMLHSTGEDGACLNTWMRAIEVQIIEGGTGDLILVGTGLDQFLLTSRARTRSGRKPYVHDPDGAPVTLIGNGRVAWCGRDPGWADVKGFRGRQDIEKPLGQWNRLECIADGRTITVILNDVAINRCYDVRPSKGRIQIQSEGAEVFFRRLDLMPLRKGLRWKSPARSPASDSFETGKENK